MKKKTKHTTPRLKRGVNRKGPYNKPLKLNISFEEAIQTLAGKREPQKGDLDEPYTNQ